MARLCSFCMGDHSPKIPCPEALDIVKYYHEVGMPVATAQDNRKEWPCNVAGMNNIDLLMSKKSHAHVRFEACNISYACSPFLGDYVVPEANMELNSVKFFEFVRALQRHNLLLFYAGASKERAWCDKDVCGYCGEEHHPWKPCFEAKMDLAELVASEKPFIELNRSKNKVLHQILFYVNDSNWFETRAEGYLIDPECNRTMTSTLVIPYEKFWRFKNDCENYLRLFFAAGIYGPSVDIKDSFGMEKDILMEPVSKYLARMQQKTFDNWAKDNLDENGKLK